VVAAVADWGQKWQPTAGLVIITFDFKLMKILIFKIIIIIFSFLHKSILFFKKNPLDFLKKVGSLNKKLSIGFKKKIEELDPIY